MKLTNKKLKKIVHEEIKHTIAEMYAGPEETRWKSLGAREIEDKLIDMHLTLADPIGGSLYELFDKEEVLSRLKPIQINLKALIDMVKNRSSEEFDV